MKLDYHIFKSIVNAFFGMFVGGRKRSPFFNIEQSFDLVGRRTYERALARKAEEFASTRLAWQRVAA